MAMAKDGMDVQQAYNSIGDLRGYKKVENFEESCEDVTKRAVDLLSAKPVEGGKYTVIVDPKLCGVFTHEAFGHLSEADFIYENKKLSEVMKIGKRFGSNELSIVDDGTLVGEAGYNKYDSEGTPTQKTYLIKRWDFGQQAALKRDSGQDERESYRKRKGYQLCQRTDCAHD